MAWLKAHQFGWIQGYCRGAGGVGNTGTGKAPGDGAKTFNFGQFHTVNHRAQ